MRKVLPLLLFVFLLIGCHHVVDGNVMEKHFYPGHYVTTYMMIGKVWMPMTHYEEGRYEVCVGGTNEVGKPDSDCFNVSKSYYDAVAIGDRYHKDPCK